MVKKQSFYAQAHYTTLVCEKQSYYGVAKNTGRSFLRPVLIYQLFRFCGFHMFLDDLQDFLGSIHGAGDQLLGANRSAQAAGCTDGVIDGCQVILHHDGVMGADLHAQTAANTTLAAATHCDSTLCVGCAGDDHMLIVVYRNDQLTGALLGTSHAAGALLGIYLGNAVHNLDGVILTGLHTVAKAFTKKGIYNDTKFHTTFT